MKCHATKKNFDQSSGCREPWACCVTPFDDGMHGSTRTMLRASMVRASASTSCAGAVVAHRNCVRAHGWHVTVPMATTSICHAFLTFTTPSAQPRAPTACKPAPMCARRMHAHGTVHVRCSRKSEGDSCSCARTGVRCTLHSLQLAPARICKDTVPVTATRTATCTASQERPCTHRWWSTQTASGVHTLQQLGAQPQHRRLHWASSAGSAGNFSTEAGARCIVSLSFHHIYSKKKKQRLMQLAAALGIGGFCVFGRPGRVVAEGRSADVASFIKQVKQMRWQHVVVRDRVSGRGHPAALVLVSRRRCAQLRATAVHR